MSGLPADLADPLHYHEPFPWGLAAALVVAALFALDRLVRWRRRRRREPRPTSSPPPAAPAGGLLAAIGEIGSGYRDDPRRGCHELSRLLRDHAGRSRGRDLSTASTWELSRKSGDKRVRTLFGRLADLQFGRRAPLPIDLSRICRRAVEVAKAEGWGRAS